RTDGAARDRVLRFISEQRHAAAVGRREAEQHVDRRRLAGAVRPEQRNGLARLDGDVDPANRLDRAGRRAVRLSELAELYAPWHFLNFLPEPHQHGSLRPTLACWPVCTATGERPSVVGGAAPPAAAIASAPCAVSCSYRTP